MKLFKRNKTTFVSPMSGKQIAITDIPDPVFSEKLMGDGFGIILESTKVIAPIDGTVISTFPTAHAYGLRANDGTEILIHIGLDTVTLKGQGFTPKVQMGDTIKQSDVLVEVDIDAIKSKGISLISPIIFTNKEDITPLKLQQQVSLGEANICKY